MLTKNAEHNNIFNVYYFWFARFILPATGKKIESSIFLHHFLPPFVCVDLVSFIAELLKKREYCDIFGAFA